MYLPISLPPPFLIYPHFIKLTSQFDYVPLPTITAVAPDNAPITGNFGGPCIHERRASYLIGKDGDGAVTPISE